MNHSILVTGQGYIGVLTRYYVQYGRILCELGSDIIEGLIKRNILSDLGIEQPVALTKFFSQIVLVGQECITNVRDLNTHVFELRNRCVFSIEESFVCQFTNNVLSAD